jgi:hypothetical protein
MDRFSHNYEHASELGLLNVRPQAAYRYIYPFDESVLTDLCYYFDYDNASPTDDGGWLPSLYAQVNFWKGRRDRLRSQRAGARLILDDTRPVATAPQVVLEGTRALICEYCDRSRTARQTCEWLARRYGLELSEEAVAGILEECTFRKLMVKDGKAYLSLAVMSYQAEFEVDADDDKPCEASTEACRQATCSRPSFAAASV